MCESKVHSSISYSASYKPCKLPGVRGPCRISTSSRASLAKYEDRSFKFVKAKHSTNFPSSTVVLFDLETTGLSVYNCDILQIGAVSLKDGKLFCSYMEPRSQEIGENATKVNVKMIISIAMRKMHYCS